MRTKYQHVFMPTLQLTVLGCRVSHRFVDPGKKKTKRVVFRTPRCIDVAPRSTKIRKMQ